MKKIIILSDSDAGGGAAIAAFRFHKMLRKFGFHSYMIVREKHTNDQFVIGPTQFTEKFLSKLYIYINRLFSTFFVLNKHTLFTYNYFSFYWINNIITKIDPDVVNIHWINENMLSFNEISKIKYPIIFTLHDMNLFTGGCHYSSNCTKFLTSCSNCPVLRNEKYFNLASYLQKKKKYHLSKINNLLISGPSKWICEQAKNSSILENRIIINIPNPIDVSKFTPLNFSKNGKKKILFGAINSLYDKRKGYKYLCEAINLLDPEKFCLEIFGNRNSEVDNNLKSFDINFYGHLSNEDEIINLYRSCDVFVVPSIQENFSNAILESLSCGLPVVCFDIGGNSDMVKHKFNGYISKPFESSDIKNGIEWCIQNYDHLTTNASQFIHENFSENKIHFHFLDILRIHFAIN